MGEKADLDGKDKKMLLKFENKSNRVKGISFHPRRPWILASLHNGVIQLWDYRMEVLVDKFEEHEGPVRGIHFHSSQPLFVSGGDDYKIKVWNYQQRRCIFNLLGHLDYIRTVQFHPTYPWILSASDDQTLRIWNWQSRSCISVLTGHNHYVMCAQFHPKEDLILSASLDQTIRVWDFSGLRKKTVSNAGDFGLPASTGSATGDLFGASDVVVKHVLEGHTRGVNWASFHPVSSLIISAADDREVKLWRMNETKAWEVDTFRGHINNVSCAVFHPKKGEIAISNSEDKTIRVWDTTKASSPLVLRRDHDRYWILDAHPNLNLLAAGHDSGLVVFKLSRERPAMDLVDSSTFLYFKDQSVYEYNLKTNKDRPILSLRRGRGVANPRSLHYNTANKAQHNIILVSDGDASYELYVLNKGTEGRGGEETCLKGSGRAAAFVSRNRFAVLDKTKQVHLKNLKNETKRKIVLPNLFVTHIFEGGVGRVLLRASDSVVLYDIQSLRVIGELPISSRTPIKYVSWASDYKLVALMTKNSITIANQKLQEQCNCNENTRVKSGVWDPVGVFVYTTATHIKYLLPNGDGGIIRTLDTPVYLISLEPGALNFIDREGRVGKIQIDTTEYQFKLALVKNKNREVLRIMQSKKLVGESIISYLQHKGYPEVALHFVDDDRIKFALALECGNIVVALECAARLDKAECWHKLGVEALRQGNHQVVEAAYQKTKNFERLSFLYLITGNLDKLAKMLHIAQLRGDLLGRFHNALYLGNVRERVAVLREAGHPKLALLTAKVHGLEEEAAALEAEVDDPEAVLAAVPENAQLLFPPPPILKESNWPLVDVGKGFFEQLGDDEKPQEGVKPEVKLPVGVTGEEEDEGDEETDWAKPDKELRGAGGAAVGGGWAEDGDDILLPETADDKGEREEEEGDVIVVPSRGKGPLYRWANSPTLAAEACAGGAFDVAMHLLNRQIGVVNFAPLKASMLLLHNAAICYLPLLHNTNPAPSPLLRGGDDERREWPLLAITLAACVDKLKNGYRVMTEGNFPEALGIFLEILHTLPLVVVDSQAQVQEVLELRDICREYTTAIRLEMARKAATDPVRQAQLAAYFTHCKLQQPHIILALAKVAIKCCYNIKNNKTTAGMCRRLLELCALPSNKEIATAHVKVKQMKGVLKMCEESNTDAHDIDFDESASFVICCESMTPIHKGTPASRCPYCGSTYKAQYDRTLCRTCQLSKIGAETSGLRCLPDRL